MSVSIAARLREEAQASEAMSNRKGDSDIPIMREAADVIDQLLAALKGVVAIADRKTDEFDRAHAAIAKAEGR